MSEPHYSIARGRSLEAARTFWTKRTEAIRAAQEEADRFGAVCAIGGSHAITALRPPEDAGEPPWELRVNSKGLWVPNKRRKAGKALAKRWRSMGVPGTAEMLRLLWRGNWPPGVLIFGVETSPSRYHGVGLRRFGDDDFVFSVPKPYEHPVPVPPDAEPMKRSEYWARVEAQKAERGAA